MAVTPDGGWRWRSWAIGGWRVASSDDEWRGDEKAKDSGKEKEKEKTKETRKQ
jgi:hypothetical protein